MATETRSPGTLADDSGAGFSTWSNPSNAGASDNSYATVSGGPTTESHYLKGTNCGFTTIGDSDTLTQLKLRIERKVTLGAAKDAKLYLVIGGTIQTGTNYADTGTAYPGSDTYAEYTISSGLPTVAQLKNSGFGLAWTCKESTGSGGFTAACDHLEVVATYTPADPKVVTPATASLVTTGYAPTIRLDKIPKPATAALTLTGYAPTALLGGSAIALPAAGGLVLTTYAPTIRLDKIVQPPVATLTLTPFAPAARLGINASPAAAALVVTGYAPTVRTPRVARPGRLALTLTPFAPSAPVAREWQIQRLTLHDG